MFEPTPLFKHRFLLNSGKGGTGKTTMSVAMAVALAREGRRVLLMQLNVHDRVGALFGKPPVGPEIVELAPRLFAVNTTPPEALREYVLMTLKVKLLYRAVFENRLVARFLRMVPGLPELLMLGKAFHHEREQRDGRAVWDAVIVDAPATGHGLFLMQIPQVITDALGDGPMVGEARRMMELLRDPERTSVNIITLTEEMPVNETLEYRRQLHEQLHIEVGAIVANGVYPVTFNPVEIRHARELRDAHRLQHHGDGDDGLAALLDAALFRDERCALQGAYLERLRRETGRPVLEVPFYFAPTLDRGVIERMATHLLEWDRRAGGAT